MDHPLLVLGYALRPDPSDVPRTSGIETTRLEAHAASD